MRSFSLAHLTALSLAPPVLIRLAAATGYQSVGLRLLEVAPNTPFHPLMTDAAMLRETLAAVAGTGVGVHDIEFIRITPETDVMGLEPFFATGAELGARWVVAGPYDSDLSRLTDRFGELCDRAGQYGLGIALEFFPWTEIRGVTDANAIVEGAGRDNGAILVDTLHFDRCDCALSDLATVRAARLPFVHVCDVPAERPSTLEGLLHHARAERLPPGEGGIAIRAVVDHMPAGIPIALEVPMSALTQAAGPEAVLRRVIEGARRLFPD